MSVNVTYYIGFDKDLDKLPIKNGQTSWVFDTGVLYMDVGGIRIPMTGIQFVNEIPLEGKANLLYFNNLDKNLSYWDIGSNSFKLVNSKGILDAIATHNTDPDSHEILSEAILTKSHEYTDGKIVKEIGDRDNAIGVAIIEEASARDSAIGVAVAQAEIDRDNAITEAINQEVLNRNDAISLVSDDITDSYTEAINQEAIARDAAIAVESQNREEAILHSEETLRNEYTSGITLLSDRVIRVEDVVEGTTIACPIDYILPRIVGAVATIPIALIPVSIQNNISINKLGVYDNNGTFATCTRFVDSEYIEVTTVTTSSTPGGTAPGPAFNIDTSWSNEDYMFLSWSDPYTDPNWYKTIVTRKSVRAVVGTEGGDSWPQSPSDGTVLVETTEPNRYNSVISGIRDRGLILNVIYFYSIFTLNESGKWDPSNVIHFKYQATAPESVLLWSGSCAVGSSFTPFNTIESGNLFHARVAISSTDPMYRAVLLGAFSKDVATPTNWFIHLGMDDVTGTPTNNSYGGTLISTDGGVTWRVLGLQKTVHAAAGHTSTSILLEQLRMVIP